MKGLTSTSLSRISNSVEPDGCATARDRELEPVARKGGCRGPQYLRGRWEVSFVTGSDALCPWGSSGGI